MKEKIKPACLWCYGWFWLLVLPVFPALAQNETDEAALLNVKKGVSFSKDSLFLLNLRFRMQNRAGVQTANAQTTDIGLVDARIRRLRLRFDGFVLSPKLQYYIQLSFSKADQDLESREIAQTIRDAIMYYHFSPSFYMGFGQAKLPGNRQRVLSSGNLQFAERSMANALFTLDRDFGLFAYWTLPIQGKAVWQLKTALSTGEGRNPSPGDAGLAYTARLEWLPFGAFANSGDYSEGDLEFEPKPKLSIGATSSFNQGAVRTGGQLGDELFAARDIQSFIVDLMFKYKGWMLSSEWLMRDVENPLTFNPEGELRFLTTGQGWNTQVSKMVSDKTELVSRYTLIMPDEKVQGLVSQQEEVLLGINRYLNGHRIKVQGNFGYHWEEGRPATDQTGNYWLATFQVEFGI